MDKFKVIFVLVFLTLGLVCSYAYGEDQASDDDKWQIEFTTYVWLAEPDFKGTMSGQTSDVKVDFKDIIDNIKWVIDIAQATAGFANFDSYIVCLVIRYSP